MTITATNDSTISNSNTLSGKGIFTASETGQMTIDYLYDGGGFQSELAVFSLAGMEAFEPGSEAFIQAAAQRALSGTQGHVLIKDRTEGARFTEQVTWERNFNSGEYLGIKKFSLAPGTQFAVMLIQNTTVEAIAQNPALAQQFGKQAIFSIPEANPGGYAQGQIVDINGLSAVGQGAYALEDLSLARSSDKDYNDIIFQITGATAEVDALADFANPQRDIRNTDVGNDIIAYSSRDSIFSDGAFTVGDTGVATIDYLYDGGDYQSELAVFSLVGMERYELGSAAFIQEAARRALTQSTEGYVLIQDPHEGARFRAELPWEPNFNQGEYQGYKTFTMNAGEKFAVFLAQNTTVQALFNDPAIAQTTGKRTIFSIADANAGESLGGQLIDLNGLGAEGSGAYAFEDRILGLDGSDQDYNDIVFQIRGATAQVPQSADEFVNPDKDWRNTAIAQAVIEYSQNSTIFHEGTFRVGASGRVTVNYLYDGGGFNQGELGIFSLTGMEQYLPNSEAFIQEALKRATSGSELGHVVIQDRTQAARFSADLAWEGFFNWGVHQGAQTFQMQANDQFAVILSQDTSLQSLVSNPALRSQWGKQVLLSIPEAKTNPTKTSKIIHFDDFGTATAGVFGMEDLLSGSDQDFNDVVFQITGAQSTVISANGNIRSDRDWRSLSLGEAIADYTSISFESFLQGDNQRNILIGGAGHDLIEGFNGRDVLDGGAGRNVLTGGASEDIFVLRADSEGNLITDFRANYDVIALSDGLTFEQLAFRGNDILLKGTETILATLTSVQTAALASHNFALLDELFPDLIKSNNVDGVDTSNPGAFTEGEISNPTVDDEMGSGSPTSTSESTTSSSLGQVLTGSQWKDVLTGSSGDDVIDGGDGDDRLVGGWGCDTLTGGKGQDVFVLSAGQGEDFITDFENGHDWLGLSNGLQFEDLSFVGNQIALSANGNVVATLSGINTTTLTVSDFITV